jgi:hypothetical protein
LRQRIEQTIHEGASALDELADQVVVIGSELMDLYTGCFSPAEIAARIVAQLDEAGRLSVESYRAWLQANGGYGGLTFAEDTSQWVLRMGDENDRYIHVHPARWASATRRVRANVLKTAILVLAYAGIRGGNPLDVKLVNHVRREFLELAPMGKELSGDQGLGGVIEVLRADSHP